MAHRLMAIFMAGAFLILLAEGANAAQNWGSSWESIAAAGRTVQTLRARFEQRKVLKMLKNPLVSQGMLYYGAPANVRWEYTKPIPSVAILTPAGSSRYEKSSGGWQKDQNPAANVLGEVLARLKHWLKGDFKSDDQVSARLEPGPPSRIILEPCEQLKPFFQRVVLVLSPEPGVMDKVIINEYDQGSTVLEFQEIRINQKLPSGTFVAPEIGQGVSD